MTQRTPPRERDDDGEVDLLAQYCREVARYQVLDAFTAATLAQKAQGGDRLARTDLVNANLRLVIPLARAHTKRSRRELMDLIQIGNIALMECIDAYRWFEGGASFATWARGAVRLAYMDEAMGERREVSTVPVGDELEEESSHSDDAARLVYLQVFGEIRVVLSEQERYVLGRLLEAGVTPSLVELAREIGCHPGTVAKRRDRAIAKLRPYLLALAPPDTLTMLSSVTRALNPPRKIPRKTTLTAARRPGGTAQAVSSQATAADSIRASALLTAAPSEQSDLQQNTLSRTMRRRPTSRTQTQSRPTPISVSDANTPAHRRSNQTAKKTA